MVSAGSRLPNGEVLAQVRLGGDSWQADVDCPIAFSWSQDDGSSWSPLKICSKHNGYASLVLPSQDLLILPFLLGNSGKEMSGGANLIPKGVRDVRWVDNCVRVTGFLRKPVLDPTMGRLGELNVGGFYFDGRPLPSKGGWITTMYGKYEGDPKCTLHAAVSTDGYKWKILSTIAAGDNELGTHPWSNSEAEICRPSDGRLMCVFRIENEPYGQSFSSDEGMTWSKPNAMPQGVGTVEPRMTTTAGTIVLCGGRPHHYLWFNADGSGRTWSGIDVFTHHNELAVEDQVRFGGYRFDGCSAYGSVITIRDSEILAIYDCFTEKEFGIYVVRGTLEKAG